MLTTTGIRLIEDLREGDYVVNKAGIGRVRKVYQYNSAQTLMIKTSQGRMIEVTPKHRLAALSKWTESGGKRKPLWGWTILY